MGYYSHGSIAQGYTQNGQILGAGSGYFGTSQYIALRTYFSKGTVTLFLHYNRPDSNYLNNFGVNTSSNDWNNLITHQHEQYGCYKAMRTYGINVQYFITRNFLIGAEFNTTWIIYPEYNDNNGYRNNYGILKIKYNFYSSSG